MDDHNAVARMRLLVVTPFPLSARSGHGGGVLGAAMIRALSADHDVSVLCFARNAADGADALADMERRCRVFTVELPRGLKWRARAMKLSGPLRREPVHATLFRSSEMAQRVGQLQSDLRPDVVITQFPVMAQYLPLVKGRAAVHDVQDAYSVSWYRRSAAASGRLQRAAARAEWQRWIDYESRHYGCAHHCWTLSEQDRYGLQLFSPSLAVHNIGLVLPCPEVPPQLRPEASVIGFIGSFGHEPNVEAAAFLVDEVAPRLLSQAPSLNIRVAGRSPPPGLVARRPPNVEFLGLVDSLQDFYGGCDIIVAPLLSGGGVKIKVAEALSYGMPLVTSPLGAEGLDLIDGRDVLIAQGPQALASAIVRLATDASLRNSLATSARHLARNRLAEAPWRQRVNRLLSLACASAAG